MEPPTLPQPDTPTPTPSPFYGHIDMLSSSGCDHFNYLLVPDSVAKTIKHAGTHI